MSDNIRVNDLCDNFMISSQTTQYPELLTEQIETMCSVAANGNPDVLESAEADYIDNMFTDLYLDYPGVADFARLMVNTSLVEPPANYDYKSGDLNTRALYDGFAPIPVSEPPFMVNDLIIDKVAEDLAKGTQTLLLGDQVQLVISPDEIMISVVLPTVNGALPSYQDINRTIHSSTAKLTSANFLPFMPGYTSQDFGSTRSARLEERPSNEAYYVGEVVENTFAKQGETRGRGFQDYSRSFYVDSRGLFFFDRDKDDVFNDRRLYFSSPSFHAGKLSEKSVFTYSDYLAEKRERNYCKRHYCGSYCFTGDTRLETENGGKIAFEDLYDIYRSGEALPLLRAWDPDHSVWTYQEPMSVSRHLLSYRNNLQVIIAESGDTMKVTPNHFLWIRRGGKEYWAQAGKIVNGDEILAGERNGTKVWNKVTNNITTDKHGYLGSAAQNDGALEVFNLSFGTGAGTYLNYAVCGNECAVAHNWVK